MITKFEKGCLALMSCIDCWNREYKEGEQAKWLKKE